MNPVMNARRLPPGLRAARRLDTSSLEGLLSVINVDDRNKADYSVNLSDLEVTNRRTLAVPTSEGTLEYGFSPDSFAGFADLLGVPSKFLSEQPIIGPGSQKDIIMQRISTLVKKNTALVRVRNAPTDDGLAGTIRAILPGDYVPFDNRHLIQAAMRSVREHGLQVEVQSSTFTDPRALEKGLHVRLLGQEEFNLGGDPHRFGLHLFTSEVSQDNIAVDAMLWRLICTNGLMGWGDSSVVSQKHRGVQTHEITALVVEGAHSAFLQVEAVRETVARLISQPVADPLDYIRNRGARAMRLSDGFTQGVEETYKADYSQQPASRYTLMQAYTQTARDLGPHERPKMEAKIGAHFLGG